MTAHSGRIQVVGADSPVLRDAERRIDVAGKSIRLTSRQSWLRHLGSPDDRVLVLDSEPSVAMLAIHGAKSRLLPTHRIWRISVGDSLATDEGTRLLTETARLAREEHRVLRLFAEVECVDEQRRAAIAATLSSLGFHRIPQERIPESTLLIDLSRDEDQILASFSKSTRQNIRLTDKYSVRIAPLNDPALAPRMNGMVAQSFARTGGETQAEDWNRVMKVCAELPGRCGLMGAFVGDGSAPEHLVGFAWALHHGDRVVYHTGAAARDANLKIRVLCPVLWALIRWAKQNGGRWFDLGGITPGSADQNDALGRISDFKRGFSETEVALGSEWALEPSPMLWNATQRMSAFVRRMRAIRRDR